MAPGDEWLGEGRAEGAAEYVLRKLRRRVGDVTAELEPRVRQLPQERLAAFLAAFDEAMREFKQRAEAGAWLAANP
jgi:hypothetical protein